MNYHLMGDGIFIINEEKGKIVIMLCAWDRKKERELIRLLNNRGETEIRIHDKGYIYGGNDKGLTKDAISFAYLHEHE
ncbi:MAG: hypothetical protein ACPLRY_02960 [Candidatus Bathyarchaeales archaeon]